MSTNHDQGSQPVHVAPGGGSQSDTAASAVPIEGSVLSSTHPVPFAFTATCAGCGQPIAGTRLLVDGQSYHRACLITQESCVSQAAHVAPGGGSPLEGAASAVPVRDSVSSSTHPVPFPGVRRFLNDFGQYMGTQDVPDLLALVRYRDAQGIDALSEVKCDVCGITISASAMLACSACAN